ncbi:unnamed protein product [Fraxinus pennsylvanica]|uniref:Uncharacterized protein n=1 Tax=Fraxinus pennsylvanica TaxID=56036 RepID=A0AAD2E4H5_9LAMI|nr:unnamed protein product [Fraxinus pennsylvanica]
MSFSPPSSPLFAMSFPQRKQYQQQQAFAPSSIASTGSSTGSQAAITPLPPPPPPPSTPSPQPPKESFAGRYKFLWPLLLAVNFTVGVTMQAHKEVPADMQCKDKFLIQSVVAPRGTTNKDLTAEMFHRKEDKIVNEVKLRVVYIPANPPSPVPEGDEEGSPTTSSVEDDNRTSSLPEAVNVSNRIRADYLEGHVAHYRWKNVVPSLILLFPPGFDGAEWHKRDHTPEYDWSSSGSSGDQSSSSVVSGISPNKHLLSFKTPLFQVFEWDETLGELDLTCPVKANCSFWTLVTTVFNKFGELAGSHKRIIHLIGHSYNLIPRVTEYIVIDNVNV